ncbi:hypothetical protein F511_08906 [Dorcoceras hygrometricum]|uniref:DUF8204 domain-containing protein n=1 Tax=Dorcoceras hygrometricum TaxID=472368 RepID=A0A2Z7AVM7_9LAMI|nr:hypothetical protein F511_08906 [Dorcoceras hygrometricum]
MGGGVEKEGISGGGEKTITSAEEMRLGAPSTDESIDSSVAAAGVDNQMKQNQHGSGNSPPSKDTNTPNTIVENKAKSCKGCLYYSSRLKNDSRNPLCVGLTRSLPNVPRYMVGQSEMEASEEGRSITDFRYGCVGYSLYVDQKKQASNGQGTRAELPVCVGLEVLVDRRVNTPETASAPTHAHAKEDGNGLPQRRTHKPAHSTGDDFLNRFTRNASLVANGVVKNARKVGNQIKQSVDDIFYPYRRRPK